MTYILRFLVVVALARLLPPEDFGVAGTAPFFAALATVLIADGFSSGIIQQKELTETHVAVGFTLTLLQGTFFCALFFVMAPWLARSFAMPDLAAIVRLLALRPLFAGVGGTAEALVSRRLDFRLLVRIEIWALVFGHWHGRP